MTRKKSAVKGGLQLSPWPIDKRQPQRHEAETPEDRLLLLLRALEGVIDRNEMKAFLMRAARRLPQSRRNIDTPRNREILEAFARSGNKSRVARDFRVTQRTVRRLVERASTPTLDDLIDRFVELRQISEPLDWDHRKPGK